MNASKSFLSAFLEITGTGNFHSTGTAPFFFPGLRVKGLGEIAFPLHAAQVKQIIALAEAAPYGKGTRTVLDENIRKCWQVDASRFSFDSPQWKKFLKQTLGAPPQASARYRLPHLRHPVVVSTPPGLWVGTLRRRLQNPAQGRPGSPPPHALSNPRRPQHAQGRRLPHPNPRLISASQPPANPVPLMSLLPSWPIPPPRPTTSPAPRMNGR